MQGAVAMQAPVLYPESYFFVIRMGGFSCGYDTPCTYVTPPLSGTSSDLLHFVLGEYWRERERERERGSQSEDGYRKLFGKLFEAVWNILHGVLITPHIDGLVTLPWHVRRQFVYHTECREVSFLPTGERFTLDTISCALLNADNSSDLYMRRCLQPVCPSTLCGVPNPL